MARNRQLLTLDLESGLSRKERKAAAKARRALLAAPDVADAQARREQAEALKADRLANPVLPRNGLPGEARTMYPAAPAALATFQADPHQATSNTWSVAYPFLAEGGLGSSGTYVGRDAAGDGSFCFDPWVLYEKGIITSPNIMTSGMVGAGKSFTAKALVTRSVALGRKAYVPGDPKGEWTRVAEYVGGKAIALGAGSGAKLNPLDEGPRSAAFADDVAWADAVRNRRLRLLEGLVGAELERPLGPIERAAITAALAFAVANRMPLVLPTIARLLSRPAPSMDERLAEAAFTCGTALDHLCTGSLSGIFDGPSTVTFDPTLPMLSLDLSRVATGADPKVLSMLMLCASSWMESSLQNPDGTKRFVVYDEAWALMKSPQVLAQMNAQWRMARQWGIANFFIFHQLGDLDQLASEADREMAKGLMANSGTRILFRQEADQIPRMREVLGLTRTQASLIPQLGAGKSSTAMWCIGTRTFLVQTVPTDTELRAFDTDENM